MKKQLAILGMLSVATAAALMSAGMLFSFFRDFSLIDFSLSNFITPFLGASLLIPISIYTFVLASKKIKGS